MKKRIALAGIYHESNTFSSIPTVWENFADGHIFRGEEIFSRYAKAHHEIAGFIDGMASEEVEIVPLFFADAVPSGEIRKEVIQRLVEELLAAISTALPFDGIYCVAHGAAASEEIRDVDGYWLQELRKLVGPSIPMVVSLDPHANVSLLMASVSNAMVSYATNPHLDQWKTGNRCADLMKQLVLHGKHLKQELIQLPASLSLEQQETAVEPCVSLYQKIADSLQQDAILSHSIILGFPYADVEEMGTSLILVSEANFDTTAIKEEVLSIFESYYPQFTGKRLLIEEVLEKESSYPKPVLLLDMGDNVGAGALGDSSYLLQALENKGLSKGIIVLYQPDLVNFLSKAPLNSWQQIDLTDASTQGKPYSLTVNILAIQDGKFSEKTPKHGGQTSYDMGKVVLVETKGGNYIVFSSLRVPPFSSQQLRIFDLELESLHWIIAKGVNAPIAAYQEICPVYLKIQTPGESNADATQFTYKHRRKPMLPFESLTT